MSVFAQIVSIGSGILTLCAVAALFIKPIRIAIREKLLSWSMVVESQKCQLRADMLRTYYRNCEQKTIRQYELENFLLSYKAYKALGGNSFIDRIYQEVITWEVTT